MFHVQWNVYIYIYIYMHTIFVVIEHLRIHTYMHTQLENAIALTSLPLQGEVYRIKWLDFIPPASSQQYSRTSSLPVTVYFLSSFTCFWRTLNLNIWIMDKVLVTQLCLTLCDPLGCSLPGSSVHGDSPGRNTGVGGHFLLQRIFPTQGLNLHLLCLLHCTWILTLWGVPFWS